MTEIQTNQNCNPITDSVLTSVVKTSYMKSMPMKPIVDIEYPHISDAPDARSRILITGLPVVSDETLHESAFRRICHTLKHMYMNPRYVKYQNFVQQLNHNQPVKRPKQFRALCISYIMRYISIGDSNHPSMLSIDLLPSVGFPSAYVPCSAKDSRANVVVDNNISRLYWRPMTDTELSSLVEQFTITCARLFQNYINMHWKSDSDDIQFFNHID